MTTTSQAAPRLCVGRVMSAVARPPAGDAPAHTLATRGAKNDKTMPFFRPLLRLDPTSPRGAREDEGDRIQEDFT